MRLNTLKPSPGAKRPRLRVGRGASAGQGKTCGRGVKGQRARKGGYHKVGFEGGQMPLHRRLPKRGFTNIFKKRWLEISLAALDQHFNADEEITPEVLPAATTGAPRPTRRVGPIAAAGHRPTSR